MPRGRCKRFVSGEGESPLFVPKGRKLAELAQVRLMPDELEALRTVVYDRMSQLYPQFVERMRKEVVR